jgi:hypothetical protein
MEIAVPESVAPSALWRPFEQDHWLRREFTALHMDPETAVQMVVAELIAYGEVRPGGGWFRGRPVETVIAGAERALRGWLGSRYGVGPRLARQIVSVALDAAGELRRDGFLRRRAGRVELVLPPLPPALGPVP